MASAKKELLSTAANIRAKIRALAKERDALIPGYKKACAPMKTAIKDYKGALGAYNKKSTPKNEAKLNKATDTLWAEYQNYSAVYGEIVSIFDDVMAGYERLIEVCESISSRELAKAEKERKNFISAHEKAMKKASGNIVLPDILSPTESEDVFAQGFVDDEYITEEPAPEEQPAPVSEPRVATAPTAGVTSVSVAPVTIDITPYVERAITATMEKLVAGMERRIESYINGLEIPAPTVQAAPVAIPGAEGISPELTEGVATTAKANNELLSHLLDEEKHIFDKLRSMCESSQELVGGITGISAKYLELAELQRQATEYQKQITDMQRHTMREQQGVQVNQKLVNQEQIEISSEQTLVQERQKAVTEKQRSISESQKAIEETQRAVIETQAALEEAMKAVMQAQKEIIATQQQIIAGNAKNQEAQKLMLEKQGEITAAQKEALAAQRQLSREQKAVTDKAKAAKDGKPQEKKPAAAPVNNEPDIAERVEGPVVTAKDAPAPDVSALSLQDEFDTGEGTNE